MTISMAYNHVSDRLLQIFQASYVVLHCFYSIVFYFSFLHYLDFLIFAFLSFIVVILEAIKLLSDSIRVKSYV